MSQEPLSDADYVLLDQFFAGETSAAENTTVHALLAGSPEVGERVQAIVRGVRRVMPDAPEVGRSWERVVEDGLAVRAGGERGVGIEAVVSQGKDGKGLPMPRGVFTRQPLRRQLWSSVAALMLGCIVLMIGWLAGIRHSGWRSAQSPLVYTTDNGERATITLPDGGTVILNVASRLEVPADYSVGHHTVRLVGEGLFTVSHHDGVPLTVLAGTTAARVLGTTFVVRRYTTDTATLVVVREGKVAVGTTVVTAAHLVEAGRFGVPQVRPSDASSFTFATGVLTLSALPLSAAITELDRWYDVDIRLGSPALATQHITGSFTAGSLSDLSGFLEFVLGVRVVRDGRQLTLFSKG